MLLPESHIIRNCQLVLLFKKKLSDALQRKSEQITERTCFCIDKNVFWHIWDFNAQHANDLDVCARVCLYRWIWLCYVFVYRFRTKQQTT